MATRGRQPPKKVCFGNGLPVKLRVYKGLGRGIQIGFLKIIKSHSPGGTGYLCLCDCTLVDTKKRDFRTSLIVESPSLDGTKRLCPCLSAQALTKKKILVSYCFTP